MILILFGVGVVAQVVAGGFGDHDSIAWAWGLGVTLGIYAAGRISGAHLNPAVTIALAAFEGFSWRKVIPYSLAQTLGAFVAALLVRWNYTEALQQVRPGPHHQVPGRVLHAARQRRAAGPRVGRLPRPDHRHRHPAVPDPRDHRRRNTPPASNLAPFIIGLLIVGIGMAWGTDAGYAINPARDFGPRLASLHHRLWWGIARPVREPVFLGPDRRADHRWPGRRRPVQGAHRAVPAARTTTEPGRLPEADLEAAAEARRKPMADFVGAIDQGTTSTRFMIFDHGGQRGRPGAARARADPAPARLGRAQPGRDLAAHARSGPAGAAERRT